MMWLLEKLIRDLWFYTYIINKCKNEVPIVEQGEFGADMKVELLNDGPFTIILNSDDL